MTTRPAAWISGALLLASSSMTSACSSAATDETPVRTATPSGAYALEAETGELLVLAFVDQDRYWSWKATDACRDLTNLHVDACAERGRYVIDGATLTLTTDGGSTHSFPFEAGAPDDGTALTTRDLVNGSDGPLVSSRALGASGSVSVGGSSMRLIERRSTLLPCVQGDMSGAIPGAAAPGANYANGRFTSGDFSPGGRYDPRTVAAGAPTLYQSGSATGHRYAVMSDFFPAGTTFAQANAALQRYNAPTSAALTGNGNDPSATIGEVADPVSGSVPVGCVSLEHGPGWARNTTQALHPFVGTITRYVVDTGNGRYRILTVGEGVTPDGSLVSGARNIANVVGGPDIFRQLDQRLLQSMR